MEQNPIYRDICLSGIVLKFIKIDKYGTVLTPPFTGDVLKYIGVKNKIHFIG
jgi:hypothetical protein